MDARGWKDQSRVQTSLIAIETIHALGKWNDINDWSMTALITSTNTKLTINWPIIYLTYIR